MGKINIFDKNSTFFIKHVLLSRRRGYNNYLGNWIGRVYPLPLPTGPHTSLPLCLYSIDAYKERRGDNKNDPYGKKKKSK